MKTEYSYVLARKGIFFLNFILSSSHNSYRFEIVILFMLNKKPYFPSKILKKGFHILCYNWYHQDCVWYVFFLCYRNQNQYWLFCLFLTMSFSFLDWIFHFSFTLSLYSLSLHIICMNICMWSCFMRILKILFNSLLHWDVNRISDKTLFFWKIVNHFISIKLYIHTYHRVQKYIKIM